VTAVKEHEISLVPATDHAPSVFAFSAAEFAVPTGREEEWRFTPLKRVGGLHDGSHAARSAAAITASCAPGVEFVSAADKSAPRRGFTDRVAALAWENSESVAQLNIPNNLEVAQSSTVSIAPGAGASFGQLDINVGTNARGLVIIDHVGSGTLAGNIDINVAQGGAVTVVSIQDWADDAIQLAHHRINLAKDASVKHVVITLGGDLVRILPSVNYEGTGGFAELIGLYFAAPGRHVEHRLFVDHSLENCRSNVVYKGAVDGQDAHAVWIGDVLIRANALGTQTYEINRNLVLSEGGRADSVPNLEIETGEIMGAGHASTTGRFDDEQLFYLMSRGISADEAKRLVLKGFFDDLLNQIGVPEIDDRIRGRLEEYIG
jgi:Fe-S cluster assembly protein SufD